MGKGGGSGSGNSGNKGSSGNGSSGRTTIDINCGHDFQGRQESHSKNCPMYKGYPSAHSNSKGGEGGYKGSQTAHYSESYANSHFYNSSGVRTAIDASSASSTFKSIVEMTSSPQHGRYLLGERIINLKNGNLKNEDIGVLVQYLQYQALNLDLFDISGNVLSFRGVENLFYTFRLGAPAATFNIKCLNLSNNLIADDGAKYIASHLSNGLHPHLKSLDVSGNQITKTGEGYFLDALKNSNVGNIIIKQYHLSVFGNKESKIGFMKDYLKQAQDKGVDVKNIVVDKSLTGYIKTTSKVVKDVAIGFAKCYYVDDAVTDYAADKIIAKVSKTFGMLWNGKDVVNCYAESFDDVMVSKLGVELIKSDLEIMGEATFTNAIE